MTSRFRADYHNSGRIFLSRQRLCTHADAGRRNGHGRERTDSLSLSIKPHLYGRRIRLPGSPGQGQSGPETRTTSREHELLRRIRQAIQPQIKIRRSVSPSCHEEDHARIPRIARRFKQTPQGDSLLIKARSFSREFLSSSWQAFRSDRVWREIRRRVF